MAQEQREYIKITSGKHPRINKAQFHSVHFMNDGAYVIYIPSINLSAYGDNLKEAEEMMVVCLKDALDAFDRSTPSEMFAELKGYGWERSPIYKTEISKSAHIDKEGILRDFDLDKDTQLTEKLVTV